MSTVPEVSSEHIETGRQKLTQVFRYLAAVHEQRYPAVREISKHPFSLRLREVPEHDCVSLSSDEYLLKLKRPILTTPPEPPEEIRDWIVKGWKDPAAEPVLLLSKVIVAATDDTEAVEEAFDDSPERPIYWRRWIADWKQWSYVAKIERRVEHLYGRFYEQFSLLERDGERFELLLGDGCLNWRLPEGGVHHPLLLKPVELLFDAPATEFTIVETAKPVEFYTGFLISNRVDPSSLSKAHSQVDNSDEIHPLEEEVTNGFLKGLVASLDRQGRFEEEPITGEQDFPRVCRDPVIFRRSKSAGFGQAIRTILDDLAQDPVEGETVPGWFSHPPKGLMRFVGIETDLTDGQTRETLGHLDPEDDEDTFFTKPANYEQYQIVRKLSESGCVLVQGPPGTGKTHTIANLIGHLLAQGKSVLVTSHTTKALSVVTDQVVSPLRPLAVSVLESDRANRDRLEASVQQIADRLTNDRGDLPTKASRLLALRSELIREAREIRQRLRAARNSEYEPIAYRGQAIRPLDAAKEVSSGKECHGWIPGIVATTDVLPLSLEEFVDLYASNTAISAEEESNYPEDVPNIGALSAPEEFKELLDSVQALRNKDLNFPSSLLNVNRSTSAAVTEAIQAVEQTVQFLSRDDAAWKRKLVDQARRGEGESWLRLARNVEIVQQAYMSSEELLLRLNPVWDQLLEPNEAIAVCKEIESHLGSGRKLNPATLLLKPQWRKAILSLRTVDGPPATTEHFAAGRQLLEIRKKQEELVRLWDGKMANINGPSVGSKEIRPESIVRPYVQDIIACIQWQTKEWPLIEAKVHRAGLSFPAALQSVPVVPGASAEIDRLVTALCKVVLPCLHKLQDRIIQANLEAQLGDIKNQLRSMANAYREIPLLQQVEQSVGEEDAATYRLCLHSLKEIYGKGGQITERRELLTKLSALAPEWARVVRQREAPHGNANLPGDLESAWRWKQLDQELASRAEVSIQDLVTRLAQVRSECERVTANLVEARSWGFMFGRTTLEMKQALVGFVQMLKKIGKGTGKLVPRLVREAQKQMTLCQGAVPVWVMPLARVVESFDLKRAKFDVVIIDEASQLDLNGLAAMYMAKQVVIVGDHQQVEPLAVGQRV